LSGRSLSLRMDSQRDGDAGPESGGDAGPASDGDAGQESSVADVEGADSSMPDGGLAGPARGGDRDDDIPENPDVADLLDELEALRRTVDDPEEHEQLSRTVRMAHRIPGGATFGRTIDKYTSQDVAETFVGSILISMPMLVEDVSEIGAFFATRPMFFVGNLAFVVVMTIGLLYWADLQEVKITNPILGVVPRRLAGVLTVAFVTAAFTMTLWGRVDWVDPWQTLCQVSVIWSVAAIGGALGDILPGESKGTDLSLEEFSFDDLPFDN